MTFEELREEFKRPLGDVKSPWLRRSVLVLLTPFLLILHIIANIINSIVDVADIFIDTWKGK